MFPLTRSLILILLYTLAEPAKRAVPTDVPYIICETCSHVAKQSVALVNDLASNTQINTLDIVESLCTASTQPGRWLRQIDLVERDDRLLLIPQQGVQECAVECATLALACSDILDGVESELADRLYVFSKKGKVLLSDIEPWLCAKHSGASGACDRPLRPLPPNRLPGPPFVPKEKKELDMENLIEQLNKEDGQPDLSMFSRDEIMKGLGNMGGDNADADDDEDDDEDNAAESELESNDTLAMEEADAPIDVGGAPQAAENNDVAADPIGAATAGHLDVGSDEL